jgi:hypothetical protein
MSKCSIAYSPNFVNEIIYDIAMNINEYILSITKASELIKSTSHMNRQTKAKSTYINETYSKYLNDILDILKFINTILDRRKSLINNLASIDCKNIPEECFKYVNERLELYTINHNEHRDVVSALRIKIEKMIRDSSANPKLVMRTAPK